MKHDDNVVPYIGIGDVTGITLREPRENLAGSPARFFTRSLRIETENGPVVLSLQADKLENLQLSEDA